MFNTKLEDNKNPLGVYTRDEIELLKNRTTTARIRKIIDTNRTPINKVYHPSTLLEENKDNG
jgi:hypothetical protein